MKLFSKYSNLCHDIGLNVSKLVSWQISLGSSLSADPNIMDKQTDGQTDNLPWQYCDLRSIMWYTCCCVHVTLYLIANCDVVLWCDSYLLWFI